MSDVTVSMQALVETGCPNDCGLIAATAHAYLKRHGVKAKTLNLRFGKDSGHSIVVFQSAEVVAVFDSNGSMNLVNGNWRTPALNIAKAWAKANGIKKRVRDAVWHDKKYRQGKS